MLFISHKTEDKAIANEVLRRALEHGYIDKQIFLDSDPGAGIEAGTAWERKIYESLKHTRAVIVLCSPNWLKSQWCFVELGYAKAMAISVFPIVIEPCPERDAVIQQLQNMRGSGVPRLLMIVGGSGSGKSSLLRAGVLPWLCVAFRSAKERSFAEQKTTISDWLVLPTLRYGETPNDDVMLLARLAEVIAESYPPDHSPRPAWKERRDRFESDEVERAARDFVDATLDLCQARRTTVETTAPTTHSAPTLLLAIDQFEELLTTTARLSAQKFLRFLRTLLSRSNGRHPVIGTMRSDYLDTCEQHAESLDRMSVFAKISALGGSEFSLGRAGQHAQSAIHFRTSLRGIAT